jgi:hypothetical protein
MTGGGRFGTLQAIAMEAFTESMPAARLLEVIPGDL